MQLATSGAAIIQSLGYLVFYFAHGEKNVVFDMQLAKVAWVKRPC
jgi:hypothetical protein